MNDVSLSGIRILVVEDDYYLAADAETALNAAGAHVIGPCGNEEDGLALAGREEIDCAILDVNLGAGPSFTIAHLVRARGIPLLFVTGYDQEAIPSAFSDVHRLQKPYLERDLLKAISRLAERLDRRRR